MASETMSSSLTATEGLRCNQWNLISLLIYGALSSATPDLLRSLKTDPDLAGFCCDLRFKQLVANTSTQ